MNDIHLYYAFMRTDMDAPFKFKVEEIPIRKVYPDGTIETKHSYFINRNYSASYFGGRRGNEIDKEYVISERMKVYYSTDKQKCIEWIQKKRAELEEYIGKLNIRFNESKIEIVEEPE